MPATKATTTARSERVREGSMNDVVIYTDGACEGNPGPGGWAAIVDEIRTSGVRSPGASAKRRTTEWSSRR